MRKGKKGSNGERSQSGWCGESITVVINRCARLAGVRYLGYHGL